MSIIISIIALAVSAAHIAFNAREKRLERKGKKHQAVFEGDLQEHLVLAEKRRCFAEPLTGLLREYTLALLHHERIRPLWLKDRIKEGEAIRAEFDTKASALTDHIAQYFFYLPESTLELLESFQRASSGALAKYLVAGTVDGPEGQDLWIQARNELGEVDALHDAVLKDVRGLLKPQLVRQLDGVKSEPKQLQGPQK